MKLVKRFTFDAAHFLPNHSGKCKQLHGHTYTLDIIICGKVNPDTGMVVDFHDIDYIVKSRVLPELDHHCLNDVISNPTAENVAAHIYSTLILQLGSFDKIGIRL